MTTNDGTPLTAEEERAVRALQKLAKKWPSTLRLFSWSGTLVVLKPGDGRTMEEAEVTQIGKSQIPNDGGDPDWDDVA